jgi:hypothetical protein
MNYKILYFFAAALFSGNVSGGLVIDGQGQVLDFFLSSSLSVDAGQSVTLRNLTLKGMKTDWLNLPSSSTLVLDNVLCVSTLELASSNAAGVIVMDNNPELLDGVRLASNRQLNYKTSHPLRGTILLNSGTLALSSDLEFHSTGSFAENTSGTIRGNGFKLFLNKSQVHNSSWTITNSLTLDGNGHLFNLNNAGTLAVESFITCTLKDMRLKNLKTDWITAGNSSTIIYFDNVTVEGTKTLNIASPTTLGALRGTVEFVS